MPPFTLETALQKVQAGEDAWNTTDPEHVSQVYTVDTAWRNRDTFVTGRPAIVEFLTRKWERELDYALRKELWAFDGNHIAVRFQYECHDASGQWWRSYGNELWEFNSDGLMTRREASINDLKIEESETPDSRHAAHLGIRPDLPPPVDWEFPGSVARSTAAWIGPEVTPGGRQNGAQRNLRPAVPVGNDDDVRRTDRPQRRS